jgi:hypothetical protein
LHYLRNSSVYFGPGCNNGQWQLAADLSLIYPLFSVCRNAGHWASCVPLEWFVSIFTYILYIYPFTFSVPIIAHLSGDDALSDRTGASSYLINWHPLLSLFPSGPFSFWHSRLGGPHIRNGDGPCHTHILATLWMETGNPHSHSHSQPFY